MTFLGGIVAVISNVSLFYAGHLIVRRFFPGEPASVRWVAFGLISAWLVHLSGSVWHLTPLSQRLNGAKEQLLEDIAGVNAEKIGSIRQRYLLDAVLYPPGMESASQR